MSFIENCSLINLNSLDKNIINLRQEILHCYSLIQKNYHEKNDHKIEIRKEEIEETKTKIEFLNQYIKENIDKYIKLRREIEKEKEIKNKLEKKSKKIDDFINKGKKILINDLPYFDKLPEYANKKLKIATLSPLDLINLTLRLSQQKKVSSDRIQFLNDMENLGLNDNGEDELSLFSYYKKFRNKYLYPYPGILEMKNSILRYNLSRENRLKPPLLISPDPKNIDEEGNIIANKNSLIKLIYDDSNSNLSGIYFKYSIDINNPPSVFSGIEYQAHYPPILTGNCTFAVCSCKYGFYNSQVAVFKFIVNKNKEEKIVEKFTKKEANEDVMRRQRNELKSPCTVFSPNLSTKGNKSFNSMGTKSLHVYLNPEDIDEEEEDKDSI